METKTFWCSVGRDDVGSVYVAPDEAVVVLDYNLANRIVRLSEVVVREGITEAVIEVPPETVAFGHELQFGGERVCGTGHRACISKDCVDFEMTALHLTPAPLRAQSISVAEIRVAFKIGIPVWELELQPEGWSPTVIFVPGQDLLDAMRTAVKALPECYGLERGAVIPAVTMLRANRTEQVSARADCVSLN